MRMAIRATTGRHRLPTVVVALVVLVSTAILVLGVGLLTAADAPFDRGFARDHGAHAVVTFDASKVTAAQIAATAKRPGVTAAAGPYQVASVALSADGVRLPAATVVGRSDPGGNVDVLSLGRGRWVRGPGEIVLSRRFGGQYRLGDRLATGGAGAPSLVVVGIASSITRTADAWVAPAELAALRGGSAPTSQMLYRFAPAGDDHAVTTAVTAVTAGLPPHAVLGVGSYLAVRLASNQSSATATPFVIAFAVLGIVISLLIVANVVSGAVVAGHRKIGILKAIGFTPAQVVATYTGRMLVPAAAGCALGAVLGNLLALPVLNQAAQAYDVPVVTVPAWASGAAVAALVLVVVVAAVLPAMRAGRLGTTHVITLGRAPRAGRGQSGRRLLARTHLPRPVSLGLGTTFTRPARSAGAVIAILLGATAAVFATGLATSLIKVGDGLTRAQSAPVRVELAEPVAPAKHGTAPAGSTTPGATPMDAAAVASRLRHIPGTAHLAAVRQTSVTVPGTTGSIAVTGYRGDSSWTGHRLISGRWFTGKYEAVVPTYLLTVTGKHIGDRLTLSAGSRTRTVRIVGEIFDLDHAGLDLITGDAVVTGLDPAAPVSGFEAGLTPGASVSRYLTAVDQALPRTVASAQSQKSANDTITIFVELIISLLVLVGIVAVLGVFNTTLLSTREQVRDIGILKAVGMTPRQVRVMIVTSLAWLGAVTGALAIPIGIALHNQVLQAMAHAAATRLPSGFGDVYNPAELAGLAVLGLAIAVAGALVPAGWAARSPAATSLRAE
jgi:putative ABC transport system permease protein